MKLRTGGGKEAKNGSYEREERKMWIIHEKRGELIRDAMDVKK